MQVSIGNIFYMATTLRPKTTYILTLKTAPIGGTRITRSCLGVHVEILRGVQRHMGWRMVGYTSQKYQFPMICSFSKFKEVGNSKWFPHFFLPFLPSNRLACFAPVLHIKFPGGTTLISCEVGLQFGSRAMNIVHKRGIQYTYNILLYI